MNIKKHTRLETYTSKASEQNVGTRAQKQDRYCLKKGGGVCDVTGLFTGLKSAGFFFVVVVVKCPRISC